ncbi:hypothetical protein, unknown function [Leishmania tarentolae]|uniref:Uncharacterized protein n=1 Tax=Leishmania tarentolae TaxID=5689 RepID=A0A640KU71_LEITA|nr:hypothetical protein, unknown function [Leishmania tarentolae]
MEREKPPPALRFARQWTLPSSAASDAGFATLHYPSRHTESPSPYSRSYGSLTPSPDTTGRRQSVEVSIAPGSPSPLQPSELSAFTSRSAAHHAHALLQRRPFPESAGSLARNIAAQHAQPVMKASDVDGELFWRRRAQHLEAICTTLEEELSTVYRSLGKDANTSLGSQRMNGYTSSRAVGSLSPTYETLIHERNRARLELAREREKNFLLRHRLREMDTELRRLQSRRLRDVGKRLVDDPSKVASPSTNSVPNSSAPPSKHRRASSHCVSGSRSSTRSTRGARRSPTCPRSCSTARPYRSSSARQEESSRPTPVTVSTSSARHSANSMTSQSSTASTSSSTRRETCRWATDTPAAASAAFRRPRSRSTNLLLKPNRQTPDIDEAQARDLLTWLLSSCASSSSPSRRQPPVGRKSEAWSHGPRSVTHSTVESPPRRVFHSGLFSAAVSSREDKDFGDAVTRETERRAVFDSRLLSPTSPQQARDALDDDKAKVTSEGAARSLSELSLVMRATQTSAEAARNALATNGAPTRSAKDGEWIVWKPHLLAPHQECGSA